MPIRPCPSMIVVAFLLLTSGAARGADTYVVASFERADASSRRDYAPALSALLAESLQCSKHLAPAHGPGLVFDAGRVGVSAPIQAEDVPIIASAAGARWIFVGSYGGTDEHMYMALRLYDAVEDRLAFEATRIMAREKMYDVLQALRDEVMAGAGLSPGVDCFVHEDLDPYAVILFGRGVRDAVGYDGRRIDHESAIAWLEKALKVDREFDSARRYLGYVNEISGRPKTARELYLLTIEARPRDLWARYGLASVDYILGRYASAADNAAAALQILPNGVDLRYLNGRALARLGRDREAEAELVAVVAARPEHLDARRALADIYAARNATAQLVSVLETITGLDSRDIAARFQLGAAYVSAGEHAKAMAVYQAIAAERPDRVSAYKFLGDLRRTRGDYDQAIAAYAAGQNRAPSDPRFMAGIAGVLHLKGDHAGAARMFAAMAEKHPVYRKLAARNAAVLAWYQGKREIAAAMIEESAANKPEPADLYLRAVMRYRPGENMSARQTLLEALALDPENPNVRQALDAIDRDQNLALPAPALDEPFWDVERYRRSIARFDAAAREFAAARDDHDRAYAAIMTSLSVRRGAGKRGCPAAEIAMPYVNQAQALETMRRLDREMAWRHDDILERHRWGETDGLPAEYAVNVRGIRAMFDRSRRDLRETISAFDAGLARELDAVGCKISSLTAAHAAGDVVPPSEEVAQGRVRTYPPRPVPPVENHDETVIGDDLASVTVLFVIDNRNCGRPQRVSVDGRDIGAVAKGASAAFEVRGGRHAVCVTASSDAHACDAPSVIRRSFIYEGWTLTVHCD
ncbi:tetratricopeptide repeat protein [Candidatus Uhrbacteria bacterium]|nr:tetratricopeptide repeat protein [Candidatus Uhrbacteria bacterium]